MVTPPPPPYHNTTTNTTISPPPPPSLSPFLSQLIYFESISDLIAITLISTIVLFSLISLSFIVHFHLKSRHSRSLKHFNALSSVRILLVSFISLWALAEFLRLPFTRRHLFSLLPALSPAHQSSICKFYVVSSLGFLEPCFLVTLLFLLSFSIKKKDPDDTFGRAVGVVVALCFPILVLQVYFIFFPAEHYFARVYWMSSIVLDEGGPNTTTTTNTTLSIDNNNNNRLVLCVYPLFGTIIFGVFTTAYILYFLVACCKVVSLVINKGLRIRIYTLGIAILVALPLQVALLVVATTVYDPVHPMYNVLVLLSFAPIVMSAAVGEGILVIRPIADALAVGREFHWWKSSYEHLPVVFDDNIPHGTPETIGIPRTKSESSIVEFYTN